VVLTYRTVSGRVDEQIVNREGEGELSVDDRGRFSGFESS
jgi:hypothetical protein